MGQIGPGWAGPFSAPLHNPVLIAACLTHPECLLFPRECYVLPAYPCRPRDACVLSVLSLIFGSDVINAEMMLVDGSFDNLYSRYTSEATPRHHAFGVVTKNDQFHPKNCKWLPAMGGGGAILLMASTNQNCSSNCKWLFTMVAAIFEALIYKTVIQSPPRHPIECSLGHRYSSHALS